MARAAPLPFSPPRPTKEGRPPTPEKGRGARSNSSGRYEREKREAFDDGWGDDEALEPRRTEVTLETPRKAITFNKSPDVGFDRSINPYRGCEHGCIYCFARPTHAYMGLSPGLDFETRLFAKPKAAKLLEKELANPNYKPRVIAMGTNTDPYQPIERKFMITRSVVSVLSRFNHPVTILTKSNLITRDLDILAPMAAKNLMRAMVSITTLDRQLARSMEPRASTPLKRFEAIKRLSDAGIASGVVVGPIIAGLNDDEIESIIEKAASFGATFCAHTLLRLPLEVSPLFQEWLEALAPTRAKRIMRHIRDMNGGRDYDPHWSRGGEIGTPYAQLISRRMTKIQSRLALNEELTPLDMSLFRAPSDITGQLTLFNEPA